MTKNLPERVVAIGGPLVEVLQWEQHLALDEEQQYTLGKVIKAYPEFNTEPLVDALADMVTYWGEELDLALIELATQYSIKLVYLAIEVLYDSGLRSRHESKVDAENSRLLLEHFVAVLDKIAPQDELPETAAGVLELLQRTELSVLFDAPTDEIDRFIRNLQEEERHTLGYEEEDND